MSLWVHVSLGQDSCLELPLLYRSTQDNQLGQQVHMYKYLYMYMHSKTRLHQDRAVACSSTCQPRYHTTDRNRPFYPIRHQRVR